MKGFCNFRRQKQNDNYEKNNLINDGILSGYYFQSPGNS
jgi:hypothetical protein